MVRVLSVSGWSQPSEEILQQVKELFEGLHPVSEIKSLSWQVDSDYQSIQDFVDTCEFHEIITEVANDNANQCKSSEDIVIISSSTGSLIIESTLAILDQSAVGLPITHILLAPAINGSSWAKLGKYAKAAIVAGAAVGISSSKLNPLWKVILGGIGITTLRSFFVEQDILDKLIQKLEPDHFDFALIKRVVSVGDQNTVVRQIPEDIPDAVF